MHEIGLEEGDTVLELGSPVGFFASAALAAVGTPGRVIVAGPNRDSFDRIAQLVATQKVEPVLLADVLLGRAFEHHSVDVVILTNLLSASLHPDHFCLSLAGFLRPHSRIIVIDWETAPAAGPEAGRRVTKEDAIKLLSSCGWQFDSALKTPGSHYGLVFRV